MLETEFDEDNIVESEDPGTEVLAWESLEVARKICEKYLKIFLKNKKFIISDWKVTQKNGLKKKQRFLLHLVIV